MSKFIAEMSLGTKYYLDVIDTENPMHIPKLRGFYYGGRGALLLNENNRNISKSDLSVLFSKADMKTRTDADLLKQIIVDKRDLWEAKLQINPNICGQCAGRGYYGDPKSLGRLTCSKCHGTGKPGLTACKVTVTGSY